MRFLFALVLGFVLAGPPAHAQHTRTVSDSIGLHSDGTVKVAVTAGSVRVRPWDRRVVKMTARIEGTSEEAVRTADVRTEGDSAEVSIRTGSADPEGLGVFDFLGVGSHDGPTAEFSIWVPREATVRISSERASVDVEGLAGDVIVEGGSPTVRVTNVDGRVVTGTFSGSLEAENVRGELLFGTFSGSLTVRGTDLPSSAKVGSFSGDAILVFPADAAFDLRTDISWGGVTSDFPVPDSTSLEDGPVKIGGGGPEIAFESFMGTLTLRAQ